MMPIYLLAISPPPMSVYSINLKNQASEIGGKIAVILRIKGEMLRLLL
jgi:hypothetical protein